MLEMHRFTPQRFAGLLLTLLLMGTGPASGQSVQAVVDAMKTRYQQELDAVDTYIIETDQYTSYHRRTTQAGQPMYETAMRWHGEGRGLFRGAGASPSLQPSLSQLDTLVQIAAYEGDRNDRRAAQPHPPHRRPLGAVQFSTASHGGGDQ